MYATVSAGHFTLADEPHVETHYMGGKTTDAVAVSCHLGNLYLSFQPDEARRFAEKLVEVAAEAEEAQARIDALRKPEEATV